MFYRKAKPNKWLEKAHILFLSKVSEKVNNPIQLKIEPTFIYYDSLWSSPLFSSTLFQFNYDISKYQFKNVRLFIKNLLRWKSDVI